jgi:putative intracellular protease/amidase
VPRVEFDSLSDPRDPSRWSADDLISMGFIHNPEPMALLQDTRKLAGLNDDDFDALLIRGGQPPMFAYPDNPDLQQAVRAFDAAEKITGAFCHGVAALVNVTTSSGGYLVAGKTVTRFSNIEETTATLRRAVEVMPWRLEDAMRERGAHYIQAGLFTAFAIRDGRPVTGQQQYSARAVATLVIDRLGA